MTGFVIDYTAARRADEAETARTAAQAALFRMAGIAAAGILAGLPGADEAAGICARALGDPLPDSLTEHQILATAQEARRA